MQRLTKYLLNKLLGEALEEDDPYEYNFKLPYHIIIKGTNGAEASADEVTRRLGQSATPEDWHQAYKDVEAAVRGGAPVGEARRIALKNAIRRKAIEAEVGEPGPELSPALPEPEAPSPESEAPPDRPERSLGSLLSTPVGTWTEEDVEKVMHTDEYMNPHRPGGEEIHGLVADWFARAYDTEPRQKRRTAGAAGPVHVRAYERHGASGPVAVGAHTRDRPA